MTDRSLEQAATAWEKRCLKLRFHHDLIPLMDESELAAYLGLAITTVRDWRRKKQGPAWFWMRSGAVNAKGIVRYAWDDVSLWLQTTKIIPPPPDPKSNPIMHRRMLEVEKKRIDQLEADTSESIPAHLAWRADEIRKRRKGVMKQIGRAKKGEAGIKQSLKIAGVEDEK